MWVSVHAGMNYYLSLPTWVNTHLCFTNYLRWILWLSICLDKGLSIWWCEVIKSYSNLMTYVYDQDPRPLNRSYGFLCSFITQVVHCFQYYIYRNPTCSTSYLLSQSILLLYTEHISYHILCAVIEILWQFFNFCHQAIPMLLSQQCGNDWFIARNIPSEDANANLTKISCTRIKVVL